MPAGQVNLFMFAGPTRWGLPDPMLPVRLGIAVLPPVRRGDVDRLMARFTPGVMMIVDGLFHQALAVSHAELRCALAAGWQVHGLSSMGAIRAYEMRHLGMQGYGQVYRFFCQDEDFQDDEVALLHQNEAPYRSVSEPMVHFRMAVRKLGERGLLPALACEKILAGLKSQWYGARTMGLFKGLLSVHAGPAVMDSVEECLQPFDQFRIKVRDLQDFLDQAAWLQPPAASRDASPGPA